MSIFVAPDRSGIVDRGQAVAGGRRRIQVLPMPTVRAINPVRGMPFRWSFNPYRGCQHACRYCYARVTHEYLGYNSGVDFERVILAKLDAPQRLREELSRPGWRRELVAVGTATDAYQPVEGKLRLTARSLEMFLAYKTPVSVVTKSTLALRDGSLLAELAGQGPGTMVWFTVTTMRAELARRLEPGAPPPRRRMEVASRLRSLGVPVGVLVAPVIPGVNDGEDELRCLLQAARDAGALDVRAQPLRLCEGAREVFEAWLAQVRPDLMGSYARLYRGGAYVLASYAEGLEQRFARLKRAAGFAPVEAPHPERAVAPSGRCSQLRLPW